MSALTSVFVGSTRLLIQCAEAFRARGHRIYCVVSDCPRVTAWTEAEGITRVDPREDVARYLGSISFDFLFSVVNHRLTPREVRDAARVAAINYHDSLLPAYAGFNATAWSILDGNATHGITFHRMTDEADAGDVFDQRTVDIAIDDTAFTLEAKCSEAAVACFGELVDELSQGTAAETPQTGARTFHFMSDRPDAACLVRLEDAGSAVDRFARALTFGPDDNSLGLAKLWDGTEPIAATAGESVGETTAPDGTVLAVSDARVTLAVSGQEIAFTGLVDVRGAPLGAPALAERGFHMGELVKRPPESLRVAVTELDRAIRKSERFWVRRLEARIAPALPVRRDTSAVAVATRRAVRLSDGVRARLQNETPDGRLALFAAAFGLFLSRACDSDSFAIDVDGGSVPVEVSGFFAARVPLAISVDRTASFDALVGSVGESLSELRARGTFARDVVSRYGSLRRRRDAGELGALPAAIVTGRGQPSLDGAALVLVLDDARLDATFLHAEDFIPADELSEFFERFEAALTAAVANSAKATGDLSLLPERDVALLLEEWNATKAPLRGDRTISQLFEEQVDRTPDRVALVFRDRTLTYRELNRRANAVAVHLRRASVIAETRVGICIRRSLDMVVGLLAISKAGGAYVPLDPAYPESRLAMMLEDAKAPVLLTERALSDKLPAGSATLLCIEELSLDDPTSAENTPCPAGPENLAYVIFTSGSTGRPKGVMVQHRNVDNFFTGMDRAIGPEQGVWLAVTSISFDISVLEIFWTLTRGFETVIQEEGDRASLGQRAAKRSRHPGRMGFSLFYFAADAADPRSAYRLLVESAKFGDQNGFDAIWTPERHFHAFGGLYPNPAVTSAALATVTSRIQLRAGSVVLPLHDPVRVAEEWAVVDNLSGGRIGLSFASGWHANDFAFKPENFADRRDVMRRYIDIVKKLWRGEAIVVKNGEGKDIEIRTLPRPVQENPPMWIASAGSADTFIAAGKMGANVLTNMLGQTLADLKGKFAAYREARKTAGHPGDGIVSVMLHTFIGPDTEKVRELVREPFQRYLATSFDLVKIAPWAFPAFKQPSRAAAQDPALDPSSFTEEDTRALMNHAFERYFDTAGLFGTPEKALALVDDLKSIGATEVACLVDFGVDADVVLAHLGHLKELMDLSQPSSEAANSNDQQWDVLSQIRRRNVTHFQCTPSMARLLLADPEAPAAFRSLRRLLLGGEALPSDLAETLSALLENGKVLNMYGPTETTVWSTTSDVEPGKAPTIGRPIANTTIRILDPHRALCPIGTPGELHIGGAGVVRGYLGRPDLTAERFIPDPFSPGERLYRTGDVARYRRDGVIEFLGRLDHQVKVSGYRIELGEIETVLARHPAVRETVVVARDDGAAGARLVAYVVPRGSDSAARDEAGSGIRHWQRIWDETYAESRRDENDGAVVKRAQDLRFNVAGWTSSYTGEPIEEPAMREWVDCTVSRIAALRPKRVIEIGCGTGLLLYRLTGWVEHYTGVDFAEHALAQIRGELTDGERTKVTLVQGTADGVSIAARSIDLAIVNSVAQYFPSADYLTTVVGKLSEAVEDGGHVFLGDIRSLPLIPAFHAGVALRRAPPDLAPEELAARAKERALHEAELVLDPDFFHELARKFPRITEVRLELERGSHRTEMTRFRYHVVLSIGGERPPEVPAMEVAAPSDLAAVEEALRAEPGLLLVTDLPNARVTTEVSLAERIAAATESVEQLRVAAKAPAPGFDPEMVATLDPRYDVELRVARSGSTDRFDALFRHRERAPLGTVSQRPSAQRNPRTLANVPVVTSATDGGAASYREHLRASLPEYMVPSDFVTLSELPLTPNGKIDRKALPAPGKDLRLVAAEYVAPASDIERTIAGIWESLLALPRVGRRDNIFDLGANSLLTVQANNKLSRELGRRVSLVSMFQFPTVETLAAHLAQGGGANGAPDVGKERADRRKDALEQRRRARQRP